MTYDCGGMNPRTVQCYADEDMVGRVKRIAVACHGGSRGPERTLARYVILQGVRWSNRLASLRTTPQLDGRPRPRAAPAESSTTRADGAAQAAAAPAGTGKKRKAMT